MNVLTINVGSSSVRLVLNDQHTLKWSDTIQWQGHEPVSQRLQEFSAKHPLGRLAGSGHRIVHGGDAFKHSIRIDAKVEARIDQLGVLAPLHNPPALRWLRA